MVRFSLSCLFILSVSTWDNNEISRISEVEKEKEAKNERQKGGVRELGQDEKKKN